MRRIIGLVASSLGTFLIVFALLLHFLVSKQVLKFPLGTYRVLTYQAANATYLDGATQAEIYNANVRLTQTLRGDASAGSSGVSVWDQFIYLYDTTNKRQIQYQQSRLAFDRRTAVLVDCCGADVGSDTHVNFTGLGVIFPINSQKQTYDVFDTTLLKAVPAFYVGQATVDGLPAYKYVATVAPTQLGTQAVPGVMVGSKAAQVSLGEFYQDTTTYYVDPVTGTIVNVSQNEHIGLRDATGAEKLVEFSGDLAMTPTTVQAQVNTANSGDTKSGAISTTVPLVTGILGAVLLVLGVVLVLISRREDDNMEYVEQ